MCGLYEGVDRGEGTEGNKGVGNLVGLNNKGVGEDWRTRDT